MNIKKSIATLIVASGIILTACSVEKSEISNPAIIPMPQSLKIENGNFSISAKTEIQASSELGKNAEFLAESLKSAFGKKLKIIKGTQNRKNTILLLLDKSLAKDGKEAYTLNVTPENIKISGAAPAGVFYGIQTLRQLFPPATFAKDYKAIDNMAYSIPCMKILDYPRFQWRSLMIDSCRHFFPVAEIKRMIDVMALMKMNKMHWHLTEDQGWRIEIKKYPKLTEIGSVRAESPKPRRRRTGDGKIYGPYFYTQDQIKDVVAYAKDRFITIVPEIEMPGHSVAALAAYPELGCTGGPYKVRTRWGIEPNIYCAGNDKTFTFLQDVLTEVMELFPSEFIHIGGDEAPKRRWKKCPKCQARMKKEGLANEHELQSYFVQRIDKFLASHGRRLIGWDEILEGGLAPGAAVMSWRGEEGGIKAAKMKHDVVMSPNSYCYLDHYESKAKGEPESIGGLLPLKKVYSYNPTPQALSADEAKHILGVQGNLWAEFIWTPEQLEYKAFPRGCAIAEVGWTSPDRKNYSDFITRLNSHLERFKAMKVNYRKLDPVSE